ncbi:LPXTG cell wall anchor domain-containing protein [Niallia circulans]
MGDNGEKADNNGKSKNSLPNTATNNGTYLLIGIVILAAGVCLSIIIRRKKQMQNK